MKICSLLLFTLLLSCRMANDKKITSGISSNALDKKTVVITHTNPLTEGNTPPDKKISSPQNKRNIVVEPEGKIVQKDSDISSLLVKERQEHQMTRQNLAVAQSTNNQFKKSNEDLTNENKTLKNKERALHIISKGLKERNIDLIKSALSLDPEVVAELIPLPQEIALMLAIASYEGTYSEKEEAIILFLWEKTKEKIPLENLINHKIFKEFIVYQNYNYLREKITKENPEIPLPALSAE